MLQPAIRPPPPQGISAASGIDAQCAHLLGRLEPGGALAGDDPRIVVGLDQRRAGPHGDLGADRLAHLARRSYSRISAPSARVLAILIAGASAGMTMVAGTPSSLAAAATPCAWLPDE